MLSGKGVSWKSLEEVGKTAAVDALTASAQSPRGTAQGSLEGHSLPSASPGQQQQHHPAGGAQPEQLQDLQAAGLQNATCSHSNALK